MQKYLFIDRDGTLILEPEDFQIDSLEKLVFYPKVVSSLLKIIEKTDYKFVIVTNQDGLGTPSFPHETFEPAHNKMMQLFENEGVRFEEVLIDCSFEHENSPTRKPRTGLLNHYLARRDIDWANSYVIGDRLTDVELAKNLGCKAIHIAEQSPLHLYPETLAFVSKDWAKIADFLTGELLKDEKTTLRRKTNETDILCELTLYGSGKFSGKTGIGFFDHMLHQFAFHAKIDLFLKCEGDLHIDEHHSIEDIGIALGETFKKALGDKKGIQRYGFFNLVMDECLSQVAIDFSSRPYLTWKVPFTREKIGDVSCELFEHFFMSFCAHAGISAHVKTEGVNNHHIAEATFKAFAKAVRHALTKSENDLQSTKGSL
jgi:imidazoleglycerol-phosphate dehydratase/histidinol-phosphatase